MTKDGRRRSQGWYLVLLVPCRLPIPGTLQKKYGFCSDQHNEESCTKLKEPEERKTFLRKHIKSFVCLKNGHRSFDYRTNSKCSYCREKHLTSICSSRPEETYLRDANTMPSCITNFLNYYM